MFYFKNLFVGYNARKKFRILIVAEDEKEASKVAECYRRYAKLDGKFHVYEAERDDLLLDCGCDQVLHMSVFVYY